MRKMYFLFLSFLLSFYISEPETYSEFEVVVEIKIPSGLVETVVIRLRFTGKQHWHTVRIFQISTPTLREPIPCLQCNGRTISSERISVIIVTFYIHLPAIAKSNTWRYFEFGSYEIIIGECNVHAVRKKHWRRIVESRLGFKIQLRIVQSDTDSKAFPYCPDKRKVACVVVELLATDGRTHTQIKTVGLFFLGIDDCQCAENQKYKSYPSFHIRTILFLQNNPSSCPHRWRC